MAGTASDERGLSLPDKRDIALEALIQAIPHIGSSLATLYFGRKHLIRLGRLEKFYKEIKDDFEKWKVEFDIAHHDEERLYSIIEDLNEKVEREAIEEKRKYYKTFFRNNLQNPISSSNYEARRFFLTILEQLAELQAQLLLVLYSDRGHHSVSSLAATYFPKVSSGFVIGNVSQLVNLGLLQHFIPGVTIGGDEDMSEYEEVWIGEFGIEFVEFCLTE